MATYRKNQSPGVVPRGAGDSQTSMTDEERLMAEENERRVAYLSEKTSVIKGLAKGILSQSRQGNRDVESLAEDVSGARFSLSGAGRQLRGLFSVGSSKHMLYLVLFVVAVFVALYFLVKVYRYRH